MDAPHLLIASMLTRLALFCKDPSARNWNSLQKAMLAYQGSYYETKGD